MKYRVSSLVKCNILFLSLLLAAGMAWAQDIAVLPPDPAIKSGVLPNGMRWYVAVNPNVKALADFALVQHTGVGTIPGASRDSVVALSQRILASHHRIFGSSAQDYFVAKGCIPGPSGFAEVRENATVFRFGKVNLSQSPSVMDSTLFVLMNMAGVAEAELDKDLLRWFMPSDQAIIVSGDVDAEAVEEKLRMLSYMLPAGESLPRKEYMWEDREGADVQLEHIHNHDVAHISLTWRLQRTPRELMNTVMPPIYERYMTMLGFVAGERVAACLRQSGTPAVSINGSYTGGSGNLGDESFSVSVTVSPADIEKAVRAVAGVMSDIDASGTGIREVRNAGRKYADMLYAADKGGNIRNDEYVDRCVCSFIYNTPLASRKDIRKFHASHVLPDSTECGLFNSIASASIDGGRNLSLKVSAHGQPFGQEQLRGMLVSAWNEGTGLKSEAAPAVSYVEKPLVKVKVKSVRKEYMSGGTVWTLSNGMRVMVKNMPSEDDMIHYSLSLNGGSGNVGGLGIGEGVYLSDFFTLSNVGGVPWKAFKDDVRRNGMTLDCRVGHSVTEFKGTLSEGRLDYLFTALQTLLNTRQTDMEEWEYYMKGEPLRQAVTSSPGRGAYLSEDFAGKADMFFHDLSHHVNNGIIVLVGNIDEKQLKQVLMTSAAGFYTSERAFARVEAPCSSSDRSGYYTRKDRKGMEIALSAPLALTAENYYTAAMATMALSRQLAIATAGKGMNVKVTHEFKMYPQESVVLKVSMEEVSAAGLASGASGYDREDAVSAIREVLADMSSIELRDEILASYRYRIEKYLAQEKERPEYWINALNLRYLAGKDFTTGAEARIGSVGKDNIRRLLSAVGASKKVEYVIKGE